MIDLLIGPAGSGKTTYIADSIAESLKKGKKVIFLVPEQFAVTAEIMISEKCLSEKIPQTELEVLSFRRLVNRFFREYGGLTLRPANECRKILAMWDAFTSVALSLSFYKDMMENPTRFIPVLAGEISVFKTNGVTVGMLENASAACREDDKNLSDKLRDIAIIMAKYNAIIGNGDTSDGLGRLAEGLKEHAFFKGKEVYCDGFAGFTPVESSIMESIRRQADRLTVSVCCDAERKSRIFAPTLETVTSFKKHKEYHITELTDNRRTENECLKYIEKNFFLNKTAPAFEGESSCIRFAELSGSYEQAELIACDILSKIREDGCDYSDFGIVAGGKSDFSVIKSVLDKHLIPNHTDVHERLAEKPLFRLILSALAAASDGLTTEHLMACAKTGLCGVTPEETVILETYCRTWAIGKTGWMSENKWLMNPDGYNARRRDDSELRLEAINRTRFVLAEPIKSLSEKIGDEGTARDFCTALYEYLNETDVCGQMKSADDVRVMNSLYGMLDDIVDVLGQKKISGQVFYEILTLAVSAEETPTLQDCMNEVSVSVCGQIKSGGVKHLYMYGCNTGVFPPEPSEDSLFTDSELIMLEGQDLYLTKTVSEKSARDGFDFYSSMCLASESLMLLCSLENGQTPCEYYNSVKMLISDPYVITSENLTADILIQDRISAWENRPILCDGDEKDALDIVLGETGSCGISSGKNEKISPAAASKLLGNREVSPSLLETYAKCAFGFGCRYGLSLREYGNGEFNPLDLGHYLHYLLEKFFARIMEIYGKITDIDDAEIDDMITELTENYFGSIFGDGGIDCAAPSLRFRFEKLRETAVGLIRMMVDELTESEFCPILFEQKIGRNGVMPSKIILNDGSEIRVVGTVDRIDIEKKDGKLYFRIVDYKTNGKKFDEKSIQLGFNMQMLIYMFSVADDPSGFLKNRAGTESEPIPAGILYYRAMPKKINVENKAGGNPLTPSGMLLKDEDVLGSMGRSISDLLKDSSQKDVIIKAADEIELLKQSVFDKIKEIADEILSGNMAVDPDESNKDSVPCIYCKYKMICRDEKAIRERRNH